MTSAVELWQMTNSRDEGTRRKTNITRMGDFYLLWSRQGHLLGKILPSISPWINPVGVVQTPTQKGFVSDHAVLRADGDFFATASAAQQLAAVARRLALP
jgi:hypothetical protein